MLALVLGVGNLCYSVEWELCIFYVAQALGVARLHILGIFERPYQPSDAHDEAWGAQGRKTVQTGNISRPYWEPSGSIWVAVGPFWAMFLQPCLQACFVEQIWHRNKQIWGWKMCIFCITVMKITILAKSAPGQFFGNF